jgi:hypothetical protein
MINLMKLMMNAEEILIKKIKNMKFLDLVTEKMILVIAIENMTKVMKKVLTKKIFKRQLLFNIKDFRIIMNKSIKMTSKKIIFINNRKHLINSSAHMVKRIT